MAILASRSSSVNSEPSSDLAGIYREFGQFHPDLGRLAEDPPADDLDRLDVLSSDLDAEAAREREDWAARLLTDLDAIGERFELETTYDLDYRSRELYEARESERLVSRPRAGSMRLGAEEDSERFG